MSWVAAAVIGSTLVGGYMSSQASESAAQTQADAANNAIGANKEAAAQQAALRQPYRAAGETAQNKLMQYLGLTSPNATATGAATQTQGNFDGAAYLAANPDVAANEYYNKNPYQHYLDYGQNEGRAFMATPAATQASADYTASPDFGKYASAEFKGVPGFDSSSLMNNFTMADFQADPGYAFRLKEGMNAMNATAAARGGLISGNALKAGQQYGQEMGSQEYQNAFNRYNANRAFQAQEYGNAFNRFQTERGNTLAPFQNLAASGQAAAAGQAANIGNMAGANAALSTGAANATAAGQVGSANAYTNAIGQGIGAYQMNQLINRSAYSPTSPYNYYGANGGNYGPTQSGGNLVQQ